MYFGGRPAGVGRNQTCSALSSAKLYRDLDGG